MLKYGYLAYTKRIKPLSGQRKECRVLGKKVTCWCLALLLINHLIQHTPNETLAVTMETMANTTVIHLTDIFLVNIYLFGCVRP